MNKPNILSLIGAAMLLAGCSGSHAPDIVISPATTSNEPAKEQVMSEKVVKTDAEWKKQLTPEQYAVLRQKGTERAFTGAYWNTKDKGVYRCAGCGEVLFQSDTKFDSGCG